jgi:amino-acid N-acetyltransferase
MVIVRKAGRCDSKKIRSLVWQSRLNPFGLHWKRFFVGCDSTGKVLACCQIKRHWDGSQELASVVVSPDFRGRGIGSQLISYLLEDQDIILYLICRVSLRGFYQKFGFEMIDEKEMPPYFLTVLKMMDIFSRFRLVRSDLVIMKRDR